MGRRGHTLQGETVGIPFSWERWEIMMDMDGNRLHSQAPKDADYARAAIREMQAGTPSLAARKALAKGVLRLGNYTAAGKAVFARWLEEGCR